MRKIEPYDETINYEELLTRYLKYLYKDWISVPRNAKKYPPMVGRNIQFSFHHEAHDTKCGRCFISGDLHGRGVDVEKDEPLNMTFYKLFNKVLRAGILLSAHTGLVVDDETSFYKGTVAELKAQLGC